jgi:hypothetical protein
MLCFIQIPQIRARDRISGSDGPQGASVFTNFREELSPKLARMALKISEFGHFKIGHRKGILLKDADALSRLPARDPLVEDEEDTNIATLFVGNLNADTLVTAQTDDRFIRQTHEKIIIR